MTYLIHTMTHKHETLADSFRAMDGFDKATVAFLGLSPVVMGFIGYQGIANHFYEATHTTLTQGDITYQLTGPSSVTQQQKGGQTYTYDFANNTIHVSDAALQPKTVKAGLQMFQTYSSQRVRDQATPESVEIKPVDAQAAEQARAAGCSIASHLSTLSRQDAPLISPTHAKIQQRGHAFKADFC